MTTRSESPRPAKAARARRVDTLALAAIIDAFAPGAPARAVRDRGAGVLRIEVDSLIGAARPFAHTYRPEEVALGEEEHARLTSEAKVEGTASRKGGEIRLRGKIDAEVEVACDRCLARVRLPLEVEFDTAFIPQAAEAVKTENVELLAADMGLSAYDGDAVDLDELVREQIVLALPSRRLCREACKGLCPVCGADLNTGECDCGRGEIDPRWSALADLKDKKG